MCLAFPELPLPGRWGGNPHARRVAAAVVFAVLVVMFVARPVRKVWMGNDFVVYHEAARAALEGGDLYQAASPDGRPYIYPPTLAVLLAPLAWLPAGIAGLVWLAAKLAALVWCLRTLGRLLPPVAGRAAWSVPVLGLACVYTLVDNELCNGQADLWVLACIVWALDAVVRGRPFLSGLAIGLGAALKLTPLFLGLWLLARRSWRGLVGLAVGLVVFLLVVPAIALGPGRAWEANARFVDLMVAPYLRGGAHEVHPPRDMPGYSARAAAYRVLGAPRPDGYGEDTGLHALHLAPRTTEWIYRVLAGLLVVAAWLATRPRAREDDPWACSREIALFAATMVIVAPLSRAAHFVVLLPAAVWVAGVWRRRGARRLAPVFVAAALLINVPFLFLPRAAKLVVAGNGALLLGALLLWLALARRGEGAPTA